MSNSSLDKTNSAISTQAQVIVTFDKQQCFVPVQIANDDNLLRQAFAAVSPDLAEAEIKRDNGKIEIVPRKGKKGTPLERLDAQPSSIPPAVLVAAALMRGELYDGFALARCTQMADTIDEAIAQSAVWRKQVDATIDRLENMKGISVVVEGA